MIGNDRLGPHPAAKAIFSVICVAVGDLGRAQQPASKSQIGFGRGHPFAAVWRPGRYLGGIRPPMVLRVFLRRMVGSPPWKEVVKPKPGRFTQHLEINDANGVGAQVRGWLW